MVDIELKNKLYEGFNVLSRRGRGGTYQYVGWKDIADRMNNIFGINWSSEIKSLEVLNGNVIVRVRVEVYDAGANVVSYQEGFGGAPLDEKLEAGNPHKAAYSKALKDACKKWGVALFLEDDDDVDKIPLTTAMPNIPAGFSGREVAVPETITKPPVVFSTPIEKEKSNVGMIPTPPFIKAEADDVPFEAPSAPSFPPAQQASAISVPSIPAPPKDNKSNGGSMSVPPTPSKGMAQKGGPPVPPPINNKISLSNDDLPMTNVGTHPGAKQMISDVQKAALQSILSMKGVEYSTLVQEAFDQNNITKTPIPDIEGLSYQEAVFVVKYGNDKFRKR